MLLIPSDIVLLKVDSFYELCLFTATTRKVYLKKLAKLLESGDALDNHDDEEEEDEG